MKDKSLRITGWVLFAVGLITAAVNRKYFGGYSEPIMVQTSTAIVLYIVTIVTLGIGFLCHYLRRKE